ncbi:GNAT family N-acetyltransferase [Alicyclobacillus sp. SO9]|nr:GNAT family N-acetyltransferase [Alicyclobacillus sp. SO9]
MVIRAPVSSAEKDWVRKLWESEWGGATMISRGKTYRLAELSCLVAVEQTEVMGAATYHVDADSCELVSINAIRAGLGVGTQLLRGVENAARLPGSSKVWIITSNDNLDAMKFYQRRGYRMTQIYVGAIDNARLQKETIPRIGNYGIEIHDEIELAKPLKYY